MKEKTIRGSIKINLCDYSYETANKIYFVWQQKQEFCDEILKRSQKLIIGTNKEDLMSCSYEQLKRIHDEVIEGLWNEKNNKLI